MKKVYSKPCIAVEDFLIQDSIAAGCAVKINIGNGNSCKGYTLEGVPDTLGNQILGWVNMGYFTSGLCSLKYEGPEATDGICYFTAVNNVFRS